MADKYISLENGALTEVEALDTSAGGGDAGKIPALDGSGRLSSTMMPVGIGADTKSIEAGENLAAGDLVNVYDDSGQKVRKADASNGRRAHGFVLSSVTSGQPATVYFEGMITGLTSLTPGDTMFLSAGTAGEAADSPPSDPGDIVQEIGAAVSTTEISFEPGQPITLA